MLGPVEVKGVPAWPEPAIPIRKGMKDPLTRDARRRVSRLWLGNRFEAATESAANLCRFLIRGQQELVPTFEGHELPLLRHLFSAQNLSRRPTRIREEAAAISRRDLSSSVHRRFPFLRCPAGEAARRPKHQGHHACPDEPPDLRWPGLLG